jgi:hypothetical protein
LSGRGGDSGEMEDPWSLSDADLDRLLAGKAPRPGTAFDPELAAFVQDLRAALTTPPPADVAARHIAAATEISRLATEQGDPAVRPASKAHGPEGQASGLPKWRRRSVLSSVFASLTAKIAGVTIAAMAATGGLAAAGALPAPAQAAVASAAASVGITLPAPPLEVSDPAPVGVTPTAGVGVTGTTGDSGPGGDEDTHGVTLTAGVTPTVTESPEHGACVSYAAHAAGSLGLSGDAKGHFVSLVAQDPTALSAKVSPAGVPDAACQAAIAKALAAVQTLAGHGDPNKEPEVTGTVTPGTGDSDGDDQDAGSHGQHGVTGTVTSVTGTASDDPAEHGSGDSSGPKPGSDKPNSDSGSQGGKPSGSGRH